MIVTVIGRGHGGTRAMSHTLSESGFYMGAQINPSGDLIPPEDMYEACRVMARYVRYLGNMMWDFSKLFTMPIDPEFTRLIESYLASVLSSDSENKGWKIPETTLVYPWIARMFPDIHYIHWTRDPRDSILGAHVTDDLSRFEIPYDHTDDTIVQRAISWKYQREIVKATPPPMRTIDVRFEDFVLRQDETLKRLERFLGVPLAKIEVNPEAVGRWRTSEERLDFEFLREDMQELGYGD
jgi:hypothetical protein